jgi:hypothetical protein
MKVAFLIAALGIAVPASAHEASVVHNGQAVSLKYEPQIQTRFHQVGIGPRASAACQWQTRIAVVRTATDAEGRSIAALTRRIDMERKRSGTRVGYCNDFHRSGEKPGADTATVSAHIAAVAQRDATTLRTELASLASLGAKDAYAR